MNRFKKFLALCLALTFLAACGPKNAETTPTPEPTPVATPTPEPTETPSPAQDEAVRASMLKGPTGLGAAKLMEDKADSATMAFTVFAEPTQAVAALTKGEVDIAALPTNLAANLYNKNGDIQLLCLNTLGVLYILENGQEIADLSDLRGKTVYATGQGANPEYVLRYLLRESGLDPDTDVDLQWKGTADEVSALMAAGEAQVCMLPVPAATSVLMQNKDVRSTIDLTQVWDETTDRGVLTMGCVVARKAFVETNPEAVELFLDEYGASIAYMSDPANLDEAAALAEKHGIVPKAALAKKALPDANLCFVTGDDMIQGIQGYYQVLYDADPASVGGALPGEDFYYHYEG